MENKQGLSSIDYAINEVNKEALEYIVSQSKYHKYIKSKQLEKHIEVILETPINLDTKKSIKKPAAPRREIKDEEFISEINLPK